MSFPCLVTIPFGSICRSNPRHRQDERDLADIDPHLNVITYQNDPDNSSVPIFFQQASLSVYCAFNVSDIDSEGNLTAVSLWASSKKRAQQIYIYIWA